MMKPPPRMKMNSWDTDLEPEILMMPNNDPLSMTFIHPIAMAKVIVDEKDKTETEQIVAWKEDRRTVNHGVPWLVVAFPGLCGHYGHGNTVAVCLN